MREHACIIRGSARPRTWLSTQLVTSLLTGGQTDKQLAVAHVELRRGVGSPPHIHRREDEAFYVLDGEVTFLFGDKLVVAGPGAFVWAPRGIAHNFACTSDTAKALLLVTPTDFEAFAAGFSEPAVTGDEWPAMKPEWIDTILRTAPSYGIEMLPPSFAMPTATVAAPGASARRWVMGEHVSYLATADQTSGQFTVVEIQTAPAGGPPPHVHTDCDELMYVVSGTHQVLLDGVEDVAHPGDLVWIPKGTRHAYSNCSTQTGKTLSIHTPGGFERFFDEAGVDADVHEVAPRLAPPPREVLEALLARHGMTA